jgi:hypothetical protein
MEKAIAAWRTLLWLASEWGCRGRRLSLHTVTDRCDFGSLPESRS